MPHLIVRHARAPDRVLEVSDLSRALAGLEPATADRIVEELLAVALGGDPAPPRDDIAVVALRARG